MSVKLRGIIPAMITPMNDDESINEEALRGQVRRHIAAGAHGIFCLGTNGEFYILSVEEKIRVMEVVADEAAGRIPVYAGVGCPGTRETIRLGLEAKRAGADVLSVIAPYFAAISQHELIDHYRAVAEAVDLPVVMYNMPARTGANIAPATVETLSRVPNIVGIKDSGGNFDNMLQYIERTDSERFSVFSGNDSLILWNLLAGGAGGITAVANVFPETMVGIYKAWESGDLEKARSLQDSIRPLRNCFAFGNPNTIIKTATRLSGQPAGPCRAPFCFVSDEGVAALKKVLHTA